MRPYIQYVESRRSEADKGISLNANWNKEDFHDIDRSEENGHHPVR